MRERDFQAHVIRRLKTAFPGAIVVKNDAGYLQGIPDLTIFFGNRWAMLECKISVTSPRQPNQEYYVELFNSMSYASFIYPENEEAVFDEIQRAFRP